MAAGCAGWRMRRSGHGLGYCRDLEWQEVVESRKHCTKRPVILTKFSGMQSVIYPKPAFTFKDCRCFRYGCLILMVKDSI
jgi:hypothetical protein